MVTRHARITDGKKKKQKNKKLPLCERSNGFCRVCGVMCAAAILIFLSEKKNHNTGGGRLLTCFIACHCPPLFCLLAYSAIRISIGYSHHLKKQEAAAYVLAPYSYSTAAPDIRQTRKKTQTQTFPPILSALTSSPSSVLDSCSTPWKKEHPLTIQSHSIH
jgi:hypothetical protein